MPGEGKRGEVWPEWLQGEKILVDREKNQPVGREAAAGRSEGTKPQLVVTCALVVLVDPSCRVR